MYDLKSIWLTSVLGELFAVGNMDALGLTRDFFGENICFLGNEEANPDFFQEVSHEY